MRPAAALVALVAFLATDAAVAARLVVRADRAHLGNGRILAPAALLVEDDRIAWMGSPKDLPPHGEAEELRCAELLPGLVAWRQPLSVGDPASVDPLRLSTYTHGALSEDWLPSGITAVVLAPGTDRLVGGRIALARLLPSPGVLPRWSPREGSLQASLGDEALHPPDLFEPVLRVNADNPLPAARPQRPWTPMAAAAELRRLLAEDQGSEGAFSSAAAGRIPLVVHARHEDQIRRALHVVAESQARLVIAGGDEAWKLARELAAADALVVLAPVDGATALRLRLETRADAPRILHDAGVRIALAGPAEARPDPLLLAAVAVRHGLARDEAIAAITGRVAGAAGASGTPLAKGEPADLVGFDADPLAARATPAFVIMAGRRLDRSMPEEDGDGDEAPPIALRVGRALDAAQSVAPATILLRGGRIASVAPGAAAPAATRLLDFGGDSVAVPGFLDAFSRAGLEPGPSPSGSSRVKAVDALEARHPSLHAALRAGVTSALAVPSTRGSLLGQVAVVSMLPRDAQEPRDADRQDEPRTRRPAIEVMHADAGLVTWLDDGPGDDAARQPRLRALREMLQKAKTYHDGWLRAEKKPEEKRGKGKKAGRAPKEAKKPEAPDKDPALEPWRPVLAGKARAFLQSGREDLMIAGLDAFKSVGITPVLCGADEAGRVAAELASRGVSVVLSPDTLPDDAEGPPLAALLRAAGIPVAFGSFEPGASSELPAGVAALVRRGLAAGDALAGLTRSAASASGLGDSAGLLAAGSRADVVVFDGDPMEPSSRILAVIARGRLVFDAEGRVATLEGERP